MTSLNLNILLPAPTNSSAAPTSPSVSGWLEYMIRYLIIPSFFLPTWRRQGCPRLQPRHWPEIVKVEYSLNDGGRCVAYGLYEYIGEME